MLCVTVDEPFATAITMGACTIASLPMGTDYRGPVLIAASRRHDAFRIIEKMSRMEYHYLQCWGAGWTPGHVLGVAMLYAVHRPEECGDELYSYGPHCLRLTKPLRFIDPLPWGRGVGLHDVPDDDPGVLAALETAQTPLEARVRIQNRPPVMDPNEDGPLD